MTHRLAALTLVATLALAGCSLSASPSASPAFTPQAECERNGGYWDTAAGFCKVGANRVVRPWAQGAMISAAWRSQVRSVPSREGG